MASKKIRDEVMLMTISVNSDPAQQAIYKLRKENVEYSKTIEDLRKKKEALGRRNKENAKEWDQLTAEIKANERAISDNKDKMEDLRRAMDITKMTMGQLKKEAELLRRQLSEVIPGSQAAEQYTARLRAIKERMAEVETGAEKAGGSFKSLSDRFNHYSGMITAAVAALVGFGVSVQEIIDRNNKMSDAMSGVEKNVGMTRKEVELFTRSLSDLDTRTSKLNLLNIAIGGGRLGVAKTDIQDFVEVADKAIVALGDSWSQTPDKIAESLGKVTTLYSQLRNLPISDSINQVGSSLNELAADGAASEQNINDFATRVGALPEKLKPTIAEALGLGAAFEESGIDAERSATAYTTFVKVASNNVDRFAKVMRLPVQEVKNLINTDPTEFFLRFADGLKGMDATDLAKTLDYLKVNDQYVTAILGAASEKNERFRETLDLSNKSMREATSLTDEFNKVNNNSAGIYEKIQKKIADIFTSNTVANFLNGLIQAFGKFIGVVEDAEGSVTDFRNILVFLVKMLTIAAISFVSLNLVTGVYNGLLLTSVERVLGLTIVEKARNIVTATGTALNSLYNAGLALMGFAYAKVTGQAGQATFALNAFKAAVASTPILGFVTLLTAAVSAFMLYKSVVKDSAQELTKFQIEQQATAKLNKEVSDSIGNATGELRSKIDRLIAILKDENTSLDLRKKAYEELIAIAPQFKDTLDEEYRATAKLTQQYEFLIAQITAKARAEGYKKVLEDAAKAEGEAYAKMIKQEAAAFDEREKNKNKMSLQEGIRYNQQLTGGMFGPSISTAATNATESFIEQNKLTTSQKEYNIAKTETLKLSSLSTNRYEVLRKENIVLTAQLKNLKEGTDAYNKAFEKFNNNKTEMDILAPGGAVASGNGQSGYLVVDEDAEKAAKKAERDKLAADRKAQREAERHQKEMDQLKKDGEKAEQLAVQIELEKEDAVIEAMKDGYDKEIDLINLQEQRKIAEIDKKKVGQTELDILQRKIDSANKEDKALFEALKQSWLKNNSDLEDLKTKQTAVFEMKRKSLRIKSENEWLKDQENEYQKRIGQLNRQRDEELAQYTTVEQMKAALQGRISDKDLKNIKTWQDGKKAITKLYQQQEIDLHVAHLQEMIKLYEGLDLTILNKEQQDQVLKFIEDAKNKVADFKAKSTENAQPDGEKGKKSKLGGKTDVLGMSPDDWDTMFSNIQTGTDTLGTLSAAIGAVQEAFSTYYSFVQAQEQAQAAQIDRNAKKQERDLKRKLERGQITQEQYEQQLQDLNEETDRKKAKLEYESAKRQRVIQIGQIIANTAQAIMSIWAQFPKFDFGATAAIMTGVVSALGALQIATVLKTPLPEAPGYEDGFGYGQEYNMKREQDGKEFKVTRKKLKSGPVNRPTHFIAGENDRVEMVIANSDYKRFSPALKNAINSEIGYSRGYQNGYYPPETKVNNSQSSSDLRDALDRNTEAFNKVATMKPKAYIVKDMDLAKDIIDVTDEYNSYKTSARK